MITLASERVAGTSRGTRCALQALAGRLRRKATVGGDVPGPARGILLTVGDPTGSAAPRRPADGQTCPPRGAGRIGRRTADGGQLCVRQLAGTVRPEADGIAIPYGVYDVGVGGGCRLWRRVERGFAAKRCLSGGRLASLRPTARW